MHELDAAAAHASRLRALNSPAATEAADFIEHLARRLQACSCGTGERARGYSGTASTQRAIEGTVDRVRELFPEPRREQRALHALWERATADATAVPTFVAAHRLSESLTQSARSLGIPSRQERGELLAWLRSMMCRIPAAPRHLENVATVEAYQGLVNAYDLPVDLVEQGANALPPYALQLDNLALTPELQRHIERLRAMRQIQKFERAADDFEFLAVDALLRRVFVNKLSAPVSSQSTV